MQSTAAEKKESTVSEKKEDETEEPEDPYGVSVISCVEHLFGGI